MPDDTVGERAEAKSILVRERIRDSRLVAAFAFLLLLFSRPIWPEQAPLHEATEFMGYGLIILCVFGRIWCSAFIGGWKNQRLLTSGPYSVARNPLYLYSFLGVLGVGLMIESLTFTIILSLAFAAYYARVVRAEERYLLARFGREYLSYIERVPRWIPNLRLYRCPERIEVRPHFILNAMRDGVWFLLIFPVIELVEYLHQTGWLPVLAHLP